MAGSGNVAVWRQSLKNGGCLSQILLGKRQTAQLRFDRWLPIDGKGSLILLNPVHSPSPQPVPRRSPARGSDCLGSRLIRRCGPWFTAVVLWVKGGEVMTPSPLKGT